MATRREDLEDIAQLYERAVMLRLLGPHQALRLERIRTELDDVLENQLHQDLYDLPQPETHHDQNEQAYVEQEEAYNTVEEYERKKVPKI